MKKVSFLHPQNSTENQRLALPVFGISLVVYGAFIIHILTLNGSILETQQILFASILGIFYSILHYYYLIPLQERNKSLVLPVTILNGLFLGAFSFFVLRTNLAGFSQIIVFTFIISSILLYGRRATYAFFVIITLFNLLFLYFDHTLTTVFSISWEQTLTFTVISIITLESISLLKNTIHKQLHRLETLNNVSKSLVSSLEIQQVITLLSSSIQNSLDADTYYVGLFKKGEMHLELFYDDGEFFPPTIVPMENSIAGWIIENRKSVLLKNLAKDAKRLNIPYTVIGQEKISKSYIGTPLISGNDNLGIVAVASYKESAFSQADLELIQNIAQQASMAIDNAYHHAEVERQSTLDSLTGMLNHSYFLKLLETEADFVKISNRSMSLIMLDIDYFKNYNDRYGHLVGDKVLVSISEIIQSHIKNTDLAGRWGGEEFVIALPGANGAQAYQVAERIQESMKSFEIKDREGKNIPYPTISMGIAEFPEEENIIKLIDLADRRLYEAKEKGRNKITPPLKFWENLDHIKPPLS